MKNIAIIGSGSWGVALATHLANIEHKVPEKILKKYFKNLY